MKKVLKACMASLFVAVSVFALAGCKKSADGITVCVGSEPATLDPALNSAVDGATMIIHSFAGLMGYQQDASGNLELVPDVAQSYTKSKDTASGKVTYVFTLKDDLKWSDGTSYDAKDFVYAWNRAAGQDLAADYGYMFDVIDGYDAMWAEEATGTEKLNVTASEDGKSLSVVIKNDVPYFLELCAFPTYFPVKQSVVEAADEGNDAGTWATDPATYVGNGPYKMTGWVNNSYVTYEKNEYYYNADEVTMNQITWALSDDASNMLANFKNGTYQLIDDVPTEEIAALKTDYADEFFIKGQLGTYYISFNINSEVFGDKTEKDKATIRQALGLFFDRNYIVDEIAQGGQTPANAFVATGLTDYDGSEFTSNNGVNGDGSGYFSVADADFASNCATAVNMLKSVGYTFNEATNKFTNFPSFEYIFNTSSGHQAIAEYLQGALEAYGITMTLANEPWDTFLATRKAGDYDVARNGWLADYNDPISFLDMWITSSGNNDCQFGQGAHAREKAYSVDFDGNGSLSVFEKNLTWAQSYDTLIGMVKSTDNAEDRYEYMHMAEDLLMSTGAICPLYNYTDLYMSSNGLEGFFSSPLGYKYFMYTTYAA